MTLPCPHAIISTESPFSWISSWTVDAKTGIRGKVSLTRSVVAPRQFLDDVLCVLRVGAVGEPGAAFFDRAGQAEARRPVLEHQPLVARDTGHEVCTRVAQLVVAGARLEGHGSRRSFSEFRGDRAARDFERAHCFDA